MPKHKQPKHESDEIEDEVPPKAAAAPVADPEPMNMDDLYAVFNDKYPDFDVRIVIDAELGLKISVPGGFTVADRAKVESFTNRDDLRAYVDTLKVQ